MANRVFCQKPGCDVSWERDPVLEVACPDCRQSIGSPCIRPSGHKAMKPHNSRDLLADKEGHYGKCPTGRCGLDYATEPTEQGNQYVIPGCEKDQSRGPAQGSLW